MVTPLNIRSRSVDAFAAEFEARWTAVSESLAPIVGRHGVGAMWQRTVYVTSREHDWLVANPLDGEATLDPMALLPTLLARDPSDAAQAAIDLSCAFQDILVSLIGAGLSEQLLGSAWMGPRTLPATTAPANDS